MRDQISMVFVMYIESYFILQVKCEMYWLENIYEFKQYGDFVVEIVFNLIVNFYEFRIFKIKLVSSVLYVYIQSCLILI